MAFLKTAVWIKTTEGLNWKTWSELWIKITGCKKWKNMLHKNQHGGIRPPVLIAVLFWHHIVQCQGAKIYPFSLTYTGLNFAKKSHTLKEHYWNVNKAYQTIDKEVFIQTQEHRCFSNCPFIQKQKTVTWLSVAINNFVFPVLPHTTWVSD